jgi:hypothetical protein
MKSNYYLLLNITLFFTIISYIIEYFYPIIDNLKNVNYIYLFIFRFIHILIYLYIIFFLFLFNYNSNDGLIYLILVIIICSLWKLLDCCILSYLELKMYNINYYEYSINFHPFLCIFFRKYKYIPAYLFTIMMVITFFYIILKNKTIPIIYKLFFLIIFIYLLTTNILLNMLDIYNNIYEKYHFLYKNNTQIISLETFFHFFNK